MPIQKIIQTKYYEQWHKYAPSYSLIRRLTFIELLYQYVAQITKFIQHLSFTICGCRQSSSAISASRFVIH